MAHYDARYGTHASSSNNFVSGSPNQLDSEEQGTVKSHNLIDTLKKHCKPSYQFNRSSSSPIGELQSTSCSVAAIDYNIETPPIVFHGTHRDSAGALISGQLFLDISDDFVEIDSLKATIQAHTVYKRPYQSHCRECQHHDVEIQAWVLLGHTTRLNRGRHTFPFSGFLDGKLTASMDTPVISISYEFMAMAQVSHSTALARLPTQLKIERNLLVRRSIPEPIFPRQTVRRFPSLNIAVYAKYNSVINPTGSNSLTLTIDGVVAHEEKAEMMDLWKLKKVAWRLDETIKTIAPICDKHMAAANKVGCGNGLQGITRSEVRVIGEKQLYKGWKLDYSSACCSVIDVEYFVRPAHSHLYKSRYTCDAKTDDGMQVSHSLFLELTVSRGYSACLMLRMHFGIILTECSGTSISWDNEPLPLYEDVPPRPPSYICEWSVEYQDHRPLSVGHDIEQANSTDLPTNPQ